LEDIIRNKNEVDEKNLRLTREKADLQSALNENEEELSEVMRKYKGCVATVSTDQITIQDQSLTIQTLEQERNKLREQYAELCQKLDHLEGENVSTIQHKRLELKIREMESKLELEKTTKTRMETMIQRMKEVVEKMTREMDDLRMRELSGQDEVKKMSRQLRDIREEMANVQSRELELSHKKSDLEKQLEVSEAENVLCGSGRQGRQTLELYRFVFFLSDLRRVVSMTMATELTLGTLNSRKALTAGSVELEPVWKNSASLCPLASPWMGFRTRLFLLTCIACFFSFS